jgi:hypothetical protein
MREWDRRGIPPDWARWRIQWKTGHALSFILLAVGFCLLVLTVLREE